MDDDISDIDLNQNFSSLIVGKWEFIETTENINGVTTRIPWTHTTGCKDFDEFTTTGVYTGHYYSNDLENTCNYEPDNGSWDINNNTELITFVNDNQTKYEIISIDQSFMILQYDNEYYFDASQLDDLSPNDVVTARLSLKRK